LLMLVIDVTLNYLEFMVTFYMTQPMKGKLDFRWLNSTYNNKDYIIITSRHLLIYNHRITNDHLKNWRKQCLKKSFWMHYLPKRRKSI